MKQATMLFKEGGDQVFVPGGKGFHTVVVDATEVEAKVAEGWSLTFMQEPVAEKEQEPAPAPAPAPAARRAK